MSKRVSDLSVEEFRIILREEIKAAIREILANEGGVGEVLRRSPTDTTDYSQVSLPTQRPPLEIPVFDLGPWPEDLSLRREDMYGDEGR
jgi:hypothetical protein